MRVQASAPFAAPENAQAPMPLLLPASDPNLGSAPALASESGGGSLHLASGSPGVLHGTR